MNQPKRLLRLCYSASIALCAALQPAISMGETQTGRVSNQPKPDVDIQQTIHDYILAHPEVLIESLQSAKRKQEDQLAAATKSLIRSYKKELVDDPDTPILGNPNGDVTLVEFFDYRCPYCRQMDPLLQNLVRDDPALRIVQKQYPILGPQSVFAARVALAANKQGKYRQFHDALMAKKPNLDEAGVFSAAETIGLDLARLKIDMASSEVDAEILKNARIAKELRLTGTPAFIVGSELIPGGTDLETLKAVVEDARRESH
jgi:protein-disulfide isomerase